MTLYGLNARDVRRLKAVLTAFERGELDAGPKHQRGRRRQRNDDVLIGKATSTGGIAAMSTGGTPGSGTVTLYQFNDSDALVVYSPTRTVTAYNLSTTAVSTGKWLQLKRHYQSGKFMVDFEDCD